MDRLEHRCSPSRIRHRHGHDVERRRCLANDLHTRGPDLETRSVDSNCVPQLPTQRDHGNDEPSAGQSAPSFVHVGTVDEDRRQDALCNVCLTAACSCRQAIKASLLAVMSCLPTPRRGCGLCRPRQTSNSLGQPTRGLAQRSHRRWRTIGAFIRSRGRCRLHRRRGPRSWRRVRGGTSPVPASRRLRRGPSRTYRRGGRTNRSRRAFDM